jgi:hypothetical protein
MSAFLGEGTTLMHQSSHRARETYDLDVAAARAASTIAQ